MPIRPLPPDLVRHLAAGEVVDRPASLVKELLENSLDAGATRILLEIEQGGLELIRITDDGHGIRTEDIPQLLFRHSTSKIADLADLNSIATLGFRGEALYSIAAVTRFRLTTRHRDEEVGTELTKDDDQGLIVRPWGGPSGTSIEVRDLFYNLPARRKFLKGPSAEFAKIAEVVQRYALAMPSIGFELTHNGRRMVHSPGAGPLDAILALYGADTAGRVLAVDWSGPGMRVSGHVSDPTSLKSSRKEQTIIINGRWIKDHVLALAVERAYGSRLPEGRHPLFVLQVTMPPEEIDVNVHPHKTEVRFADPQTIARALYRAAESALVTAAVSKSLAGTWTDESRGEERAEWWQPVARTEPIVRQEALDLAHRPSMPEIETLDLGDWTIDGDTGEVSPRTPMTPPMHATGSGQRAPGPQPVAQESGAWLQFGPGLLAKVDGDTLVVVDLPALHARVLYGRLCEQTSAPVSQPLLFPVPLPLDSELQSALEAHAPVLVSLGFELAGTTLHAIPALFGAADPERLTLELLAALNDAPVDEQPDPLDRARRIAASRTADRSTRTRSPEELAWLLSHLEDYRYYTSLTGQPTVLRLDPRWWSQMFGH